MCGTGLELSPKNGRQHIANLPRCNMFPNRRVSWFILFEPPEQTLSYNARGTKSRHSFIYSRNNNNNFTRTFEGWLFRNIVGRYEYGTNLIGTARFNGVPALFITLQGWFVGTKVCSNIFCNIGRFILCRYSSSSSLIGFHIVIKCFLLIFFFFISKSKEILLRCSIFSN